MNFNTFYFNIIKILIILFCTISSITPLDWRTCDQHVTTVLGQGTFSNLNYPFNYSQGLDCRIHIYVPEFRTAPEMCFAFKKFRLNQSDGCSEDYLEIAGLGRYCGAGWKDGVGKYFKDVFRSLCITVHSHTTVLTFRTQPHSLPNLGFFANFYFRNQPFNENKFGCGNSQSACANGQCLLVSQFCDGVIDCADASDESTYQAGCPEKVIFEEACSFESSACGFKSERDTWGRTVAMPSQDHTLRSPGGHVMTTFGDTSRLASLTSPLLTTTTNNNNNNNNVNSNNNNHYNNKPDDYCFSFWYKMHNKINQLNVNLYVNASSSSSTSSFPPDRKKLLLSREGYHGSDWTFAEIDLKGNMIDGSKIQFDAHLPSTHTLIKVLSLDDIALTPGKCFRGDISCTFEVGQCGWRRMFIPSFSAWKLHTSTFTVPSYMHMKMSYLMMDSSELGAGMKAVMISRPLNFVSSTSACLVFKLFIKGPGSAFVRLNVSDQAGDDRTIWTTTNRNSFDWKQVQTPVYLRNRKIVLIKLEAFNKTSSAVIVGFDDVVLYSYPCPKNRPTKNSSGLPQETITPAAPHYPYNPNHRPQYTSKPMHCPTTMFSCRNGLHCISMASRCDGRAQCYDGSDELGCSQTADSPGGPFVYTGNSSLGPGMIAGIAIAVVAFIVVTLSIVFFFAIRRRNQTRQTLSAVPSEAILLKPPPYTASNPNPPPYFFPPPSYETSNPVTPSAPKPEETDNINPPRYVANTYI